MHAGRQSHLGWLALTTQALIEGSDDWIAARGTHRRHVQHPPYLGSPAPDDPLTLMFAAIPVEGGYARQGRDFLPAQFAQFRQQRQQRSAGHRARPRNTLEQLALRPPDRAGPQGLRQVAVEAFDAFIKPSDV